MHVDGLGLNFFYKIKLNFIFLEVHQNACVSYVNLNGHHEKVAFRITFIYNLVKRWMQSLKYSYFLQRIVWWISTSMYKVLFCVFLIDFSFLYDCTTVRNQWCLLWRDSQTDRIELCKFCLFPKLHSDRENVYIDSIIGHLYTLLVLIWTWQTNFCKRHKKDRNFWLLMLL